MLTDKSDVYSFGVVLLEIICGRRPVDFRQSEEKVDLVKWVTPYVEQLEDSFQRLEITDKRLSKNYNMKSISKIAKLAMRCVVDEPSGRPTISEVVMEIKEAIRYENENDAAIFEDISGEIKEALKYENENNVATFADVSGEISIKYGFLESKHVSAFTSDSSERSTETTSIEHRESHGRHHDDVERE